MLFRRLFMYCVVTACFCWPFVLTSAGLATSREPFFKPVPPMEVYDFPRALEEIKLRGLLLTNDYSRAVVYVRSTRSFRVLKPRDRLEVILDGLRHEFRVERMGGRRLLLRGADDVWYELGVEQSE